MALPKTIAIDGPAASGKSTLGKKLADALGYLFFDTGVMYRALTWSALQHHLDILDERTISRLAEDVELDILPASIQDGRLYDILADGQDVTWQIRLPEVDANVSAVSAYSGVRRAMTARQREIGMRGFVVMVGRDIGTVVMPDADVKIFLVASAEERARRRYAEKIERQEPAAYAEILQAVRERDAVDSTRDIAPLKAAEDAWIIDSDNLTADQVLSLVITRIEANP